MRKLALSRLARYIPAAMGGRRTALQREYDAMIALAKRWERKSAKLLKTAQPGVAGAGETLRDCARQLAEALTSGRTLH